MTSLAPITTHTYTQCTTESTDECTKPSQASHPDTTLCAGYRSAVKSALVTNPPPFRTGRHVQLKSWVRWDNTPSHLTSCSCCVARLLCCVASVMASSRSDTCAVSASTCEQQTHAGKRLLLYNDLSALSSQPASTSRLGSYHTALLLDADTCFNQT
jgi:hypothetical protein